MRLPVFPFALVLVLLTPVARACSVCFSADKDARTAYIGTTAFLTFLPLLLIGGFALWLHRQHRRAAIRGPIVDPC